MRPSRGNSAPHPTPLYLASLLGVQAPGISTARPAQTGPPSHEQYVSDSLVLRTEWRRSSCRKFRVRIEFAPRFDCGRASTGPSTANRRIVSRMNSERSPHARSSSVLHGLDRVTTHPIAGVAIGVAVLVVFIIVVMTNFNPSLQAAFSTVSAGLTVTMLFVLQHTQRRAQTAMQIKLDELVRAMPKADDRAVRIEAASVDELQEFESRQQEVHDAVRAAD